ncbi:MAG: sulfatase-like hydrolase/transferase [candidate division Zixibacteria bacterium]|nr:sulfatase-like hydrolase/transferase [candidate division Zixibacteria bacterium]
MHESRDSTPNPVSKLLPSRPFLYIALVYLLGLLFFALMRLLFLANFTQLIEHEPLTEIAKAFAIGVRFDQIIILYILLPLLLVIPWTGLRRSLVRWLTLIYLGLLFSVTYLLLISDIRFYAKFGSHLNFLAYEYIGEGDEFWNQILSDPGFAVSIPVWLLASTLFVVFVRILLHKTDRWPDRRSWLGQSVWVVMLLVLFVLGIRGGTGLAPIDWGEAYFSRNAFLNQLALNGVYTLARNFTERDGDLRLSTMRESERYPFVDIHEGLTVVQKVLHQPGDTWLQPQRGIHRATGQPPSPLLFKPNVIVVLMESWAARNTGVLGSPHNLTPHFDSWAPRGILFKHFFASGIRTSFGLPAVLGSYPSLPGRSIMGRYDASHPFTTLSEILNEGGYHNAFVYGGDLAFDNIEGFFRAKQYDRFVGENDFRPDQAFSKWGIPDHELFDRAASLIDSLPRPFQMTILTLSNHEPYDLPDSSVQKFFDDADSSKVFNAQLYADYCLGVFLRRLQDKRIFDSTIVVITADHARYDVSRLVLDPETFRIPLLILGPPEMVTLGHVVAAAGSQTDILPTVMGLLGGEYRHSSWGRDLLRLEENDPGFAMINAADRIGCVTRDYFYLEWLGRQTSLYEYRSLRSDPIDITDQRFEEFHESQCRTRAFMQLAEQLSQVRATPSPAAAE